MDSPAAASTKVQQPPNPPPDRIDGPVFLDSERLQIYYVEAPPSDLRGYYSDGIEYYFCVNKGCKAAWAAQWTSTPRGKRIYGTQSLAKYKLMAIPKICDCCKQTIKNADEERTQRYEAYKAKMVEEKLKAEEEKARYMKLEEDRRARFLDNYQAPLMSLPQCPSKSSYSQVAASANAVAKHRDSTFANRDAAPPAAGTAQQDLAKNTTANSLARHQAMQKLREEKAANKPPTDLIEVPLSPPPPVMEDPAMLAAQDPSWDVISENDANEDWAIINHFGSAAIEHRDAHVDTPTVRP